MMATLPDRHDLAAALHVEEYGWERAPAGLRRSPEALARADRLLGIMAVLLDEDGRLGDPDLPDWWPAVDRWARMAGWALAVVALAYIVGVLLAGAWCGR